jgi:hypothetical protein
MRILKVKFIHFFLKNAGEYLDFQEKSLDH